MLSIIALITILVIVSLLLSGRLTPIIPLVIVPVIGAMVAGFGLDEIGDFFEEGIGSVISVVVMFIFAILYFGVMQDAGLFDPLINKMIAISRGNIVSISVATVLIAALAQLDGSGASTFLITIPALLPLYQRLHMNRYLLLLLIGGSASIMNMLPWAGPIGRSASVLEMDPTELWYSLIPIQIIGMLLMIGLAVLLGMREKRKIERTFGSAGATNVEDLLNGQTDESQDGKTLARPKLLWFNILITILVIGVLVWGIIPAGLAFMIGLSIALPVNYPAINEQTERLRTHAPNALTMGSIILAAGSFLGILKGTGMLDAIATDIVHIIPDALGSYVHIILGVFGILFELLLSTDAYYFALLPVADQIGTNFNVESLSTTYAMIVGNIVGTFISPFSPAVWLALGLAQAEMGKHIRYSLFWLWGLSIILLILAILLGVVTV